MLVALIWGGVIYRFVDFTGRKPLAIKTASVNKVMEFPEFQLDSFKLHTGFRDPFLGKVFNSKKKKKKKYYKAPPKKKVEPIVKEKVVFPSMNYLGMIKNGTSGSATHLVIIEGNSHMVTGNGQYGSIEVTQVYKDSLEIKYKDEIKVLHN